ncbi:hypothetical protein C475_13812 [Halosimplex carlsbadense 2-9-1]|uniref:Uncharacterized protein n=1 Tax=Halosimplex carlsbadense 2-9-1 TaxID=797114 RepID=M0CM34_9EURY|nr:hypothetical protein C475_13812 [Halosimplex carlsbadense 2-9-1]
MEHAVDVLGDGFGGHLGVGQIARDDLDPVGQPRSLAVREIVDRDHLVVRDESLTEVRAHETCPTRHDQSLPGEIHGRTSSSADMCVAVDSGRRVGFVRTCHRQR